MKLAGGRRLGATAILFLMAQSAGCYTPGHNAYSTARTVPPGGVAAAIYAQATGYSGDVHGERVIYVGPLPPGFSGRAGLAERLDAGVHLDLGAFAIGGDVKWLALPGETLDLALDPGIDYSYLVLFAPAEPAMGTPVSRDLDSWQLRVPLVTGINFSRRVIAVLTTGFVYGWPAADVGGTPFGDEGRLVDGAAPLVGLGFDFRVEPRISFHPEATFVFSTGANERRFIYTVGFALRFGRLPRMWSSPQQRPPERPEY